MYSQAEQDTSLVDNTTELEKHKSFELVHAAKDEKGQKEMDTVRIFMIVLIKITCRTNNSFLKKRMFTVCQLKNFLEDMGQILNK